MKLNLFGKFIVPFNPTQEERNVAILKRKYEDYFQMALKAIDKLDFDNFIEFEHCIFNGYRRGYLPYLWCAILQNKAARCGLIHF